LRTAVLLAVEGGLGLLALLAGAAVGVAPFRTLRFEASAVLAGLLGAGPMLALLVVLWASRSEALERIRVRVEEAVGNLFAHASWRTLAAVSAAAGFGEEALFRGFLQGGLEAAIGTLPALILASLAFGLVHPVTRAYVALASLLGLYLGVLWIWTENLLAPIVAHAAYDFVALVALVHRVRR
jgi:membrane protease YdiL (CAAX protease family)